MQLILTYLILSFGFHGQSFNWVSFEMTKRTASDGKMVRIDSRVYLKPSGEMVTYIESPVETYILNNAFGDMKVYLPSTNSVKRSLDNRMSSLSTIYYYFLTDNTDDMGLESEGFVLRDSRVEDMMLISEWSPPADANNEVNYAELVSNGDHPIFMGYLSKSGSYIKKVFYYDFEVIGNVDFPKSITEIDFTGADSVVTKTSFADFRFDSPEDERYVNYKVPENAILAK